MELEWYHYGIAIFGGFAAGVINTLAGSGSAITLTILTELLGLPGNMANGTNRVGVLTAGIAGTFAFHKNGKLDIAKSKRYTIPTIIGAIVGVFVAVWHRENGKWWSGGQVYVQSNSLHSGRFNLPRCLVFS